MKAINSLDLSPTGPQAAGTLVARLKPYLRGLVS